MVLYDDKKWLCRLIRTAFTIEDDSGVCEKVLKEKPYLGDQPGGDTSSASSNDSFDVRGIVGVCDSTSGANLHSPQTLLLRNPLKVSGSDFQGEMFEVAQVTEILQLQYVGHPRDAGELGHRRRSNTAIRLEKLDKQRRAQNATQFVRVTQTEPIKNDFVFEPNLNYEKDVKAKAKQAVSIDKLLSSTPHPDNIPYSKYAKFDASNHPSLPCKKMAVFITFLPLRARPYPIHVNVVCTARILELIGLLLWLTSKTYPDVKLKSVHQYNLQISDEEGEWDSDFPPLDHHELIGKFSFSHLALVFSEKQGEQPKQTFMFTFLLPNSGELRIPLPDPQTTTVKQALEIAFEKSGWIRLTGSKTDATGYHLEKLGNPSVVYNDINMSLAETKCREFCIVRNGAKSVQSSRVEVATKPESEMPGARSELFNVTVTGRFNRVKNAFCVIYGRERMDLEYQNKIKSYPFSHISGVKLDTSKNRVLVSLSQASGAYTSSSHLQLSTPDLNSATELHHTLQCIIDSYPRP